MLDGDDGTLTPPRRGVLSRLPFADRLFPGAAITRAQVDNYAAEWEAANQRDRTAEGPLWVVLGDSTGQGIGASRYDRGYVGQLRDILEEQTQIHWRVLNLSRSGDRAEDVLRNQIPALQRLEESPRLTTCIAGANDLLPTPATRLRGTLRAIMAALPAGSVIGTMPQGIRSKRARELNVMIIAEAARHHLAVADIWGASGPPWRDKFAADHFHPSDSGYGLWAQAIATALSPRSGDGGEQAP